jgi:hypothetical protein
MEVKRPDGRVDGSRRLARRQRDLIAATGLDPEEFERTQKTVARMRDNLLKHSRPD